MPAPGFAFANPKPSPDNLNTTDPKDAYADDAGIAASPVTEPIPPSWKQPEEMFLADVLGPQAVQQIQSAGQIVFHSIGDTGGIKVPTHQFAVADAMAKDVGQAAAYSAGRPAFCYHLGDVVYYFGQERYYFDQFYDAYRDYDAPIFAIPGNHDGEMFPSEVAQYSLQAFYNNFCSKTPVKDPAAQGFSRTTMTQPGVYFTLNAPYVKIIGLYSNTGESTGVISDSTTGTAQLTFLLAQLQEAASQRAQKNGAPFALILAVHHPPFTLSSGHFPSPAMLAQIDQACQQAKIWPDIVLSGHAHLYERYTRTLPSKYTQLASVANFQIPYVVAGNGGYLQLSKTRLGQDGSDPQPGAPGTDGEGNPLTLDVYNNTTYGFLRLTVSPSSILLESLGVDESSGQTSTIDTFTVDLTKHVVKGTPPQSQIKAGVDATHEHDRAPAQIKQPRKTKKK
jgi:predicted phosphodiesterase